MWDGGEYPPFLIRLSRNGEVLMIGGYLRVCIGVHVRASWLSLSPVSAGNESDRYSRDSLCRSPEIMMSEDFNEATDTWSLGMIVSESRRISLRIGAEQCVSSSQFIEIAARKVADSNNGVFCVSLTIHYSRQRC